LSKSLISHPQQSLVAILSQESHSEESCDYPQLRPEMFDGYKINRFSIPKKLKSFRKSALDQIPLGSIRVPVIEQDS
jgi:hypothetical protein